MKIFAFAIVLAVYAEQGKFDKTCGLHATSLILLFLYFMDYALHVLRKCKEACNTDFVPLGN